MASLPLAIAQEEDAVPTEEPQPTPTETANFTDTEHVEEDNSTYSGSQTGPMKIHIDGIEPEAGPQNGRFYFV